MEVARALGQGPGGRTSEGPAGTAGKTADLASGGHVQNNQPSHPARTRPGARRPLSPGAAKLGAEGHGYFWAGLAARRSPPVPPKSQCKGTAKAGPSRRMCGLYLGQGSCRGTPRCPLPKSPLASSARQGHAGLIGQFRAFSATNPCAGPLAARRTIASRSMWGFCSLLSSSSNPKCTGEALTVAGTPCAHTGTPCPAGLQPQERLVTHSLQPGAPTASCRSTPPPP